MYIYIYIYLYIYIFIYNIIIKLMYDKIYLLLSKDIKLVKN